MVRLQPNTEYLIKTFDGKPVIRNGEQMVYIYSMKTGKCLDIVKIRNF